MSKATFSECGKYRYLLERVVGEGPTVTAVMVNPSTADAVTDDPTIRRITTFARRNGWGRLIVVNKFAFITPYIDKISQEYDPVGPENDRYIQEALNRSDLCIVAWGALSKLKSLETMKRWRQVVRLLQCSSLDVLCWGTTKDGQPKHPLYLPREAKLVSWIPPP